MNHAVNAEKQELQKTLKPSWRWAKSSSSNNSVDSGLEAHPPKNKTQNTEVQQKLFNLILWIMEVVRREYSVQKSETAMFIWVVLYNQSGHFCIFTIS